MFMFRPVLNNLLYLQQLNLTNIKEFISKIINVLTIN